MRNYDSILNNAKHGDKDTAIDLGPIGQHKMPAGQRSGYVPPGFYGLTVKAAEWRDKKGDKIGKNLWLHCEINAPAKYKGVPIYCYHPAPVTDDPVNDTGYKFCFALRRSAASAVGKLADVDRATQNPIKPSALEGKTVYAEVLDERSVDFAGSSRLSRYILKDEYDARPGPFAVDTGEVKAQPGTPDLADALDGPAAAQPAAQADDVW